jgi:hypothetical protein
VCAYVLTYLWKQCTWSVVNFCFRWQHFLGKYLRFFLALQNAPIYDSAVKTGSDVLNKVSGSLIHDDVGPSASLF